MSAKMKLVSFKILDDTVVFDGYDFQKQEGYKPLGQTWLEVKKSFNGKRKKIKIKKGNVVQDAMVVHIHPFITPLELFGTKARVSNYACLITEENKLIAVNW